MTSTRPFNLLQRRAWDYNANGLYCVTITTQHCELLFGSLAEGRMEWSAAGAIADLLWRQLPQRIEGVSLGDFVFMPNHLHGIICLDHTYPSFALHATQMRGFYPKNEEMSHISPSAGSISSIIRSYKAAVTKQLHLLELDFGWQRSFHRYSIPTAQAYQRVLKHLQNNPETWTSDQFYRPISNKKSV
ncbi:MAG: transposase [Aureispira sp.]